MKRNTIDKRTKVLLPPKAELAISLIKAELKNLKFVNKLYEQGVDASAGLADFSVLVLEIMGFGNNLPNWFYEWYFHRQNELVENINQYSSKELQKKAFSFYMDLLVQKQVFKFIKIPEPLVMI